MSDFWWLFWVLLGTAVWAWARWPKADEIPKDLHRWPGSGAYRMNVVGESYYQDNLRRLAGTPRTTAILTPYSSNPHDPMAVRVEIAGLMVGHLARQQARAFRQQLAEAATSGAPSTCAALITGGHVLQDGSRAHFGVRLDIDA